MSGKDPFERLATGAAQFLKDTTRAGQNLFNSAVDAASDASNRYLGTQQENKSLEELAAQFMDHLKHGEYSKAGNLLLRETKIAMTNLNENAKEVAVKLSEELTELIADPRKFTKEAFREMADLCNSSSNKVIKTIGKICDGIANFIENPGKELKHMGQEVKKAFTSLCEFTRGHSSGKEHSR